MKTRILTIIMLVIAGGLIALAVFTPYLASESEFCRIHFSEKGQIGDTIGGTTAPIIGLIGVIMTFMAFYVQFIFNNIQIIQIFESTMFNLIGIHDGIREKLYIHGNARTGTEGNIFRVILDQIEADYYNLKSQFEQIDSSLELEILGVAYRANYLDQISGGNAKDINEDHWKIYKKYFEEKKKKTDSFQAKRNAGHKYLLANYFDSLFSIFSYIDKAKFVEKYTKDKQFYADIVINTLTLEELTFLYYHCITKTDEEWVDPANNYICRFKILKKLPPTQILFSPQLGLKFISPHKNIKPKEYFYYLEK